MMEYIAYKKFKKNRDDKVKARQDAKDEAARAASRSPDPTSGGTVLTDDDELFFERLTSEDGYSDEAGKRPPLPPRGNTPDYAWDSDTDGDSVHGQGKGKGQGDVSDAKDGGDDSKKLNRSRFSFWVRRPTGKNLEPTDAAIPVAEEEREKNDLSRVLDDLNLSARNNKTISLSKDSQELVSKFTVVLKDLVNGVPTATTDLKHLLEDHDGTLARNYEKLPGSMVSSCSISVISGQIAFRLCDFWIPNVVRGTETPLPLSIFRQIFSLTLFRTRKYQVLADKQTEEARHQSAHQAHEHPRA